jgi:hypothetical protein
LGLGSWWSQWVQTSWQLVTAIHDEKGDGLTLCEWLSQGYDRTCCVTLISRTCCEDFSATS